MTTQEEIIATSDFACRLTVERNRLKLKGAEFGRLCGVNANTQSIYENGRRLPDAAYLMRASLAGVDVLYVVTGRRAPDLGEGEAGAQLQRVINLWPSLSAAAHVALANLLDALTTQGQQA